ncbi:MAG TPA: FAD-dependent thymidylate synthase, partial [Candidatus Nanopelagicales bacterium]|nr:FAD-dependent thymidylate synthase [Candidatus Nanopelagicales bacterium]
GRMALDESAQARIAPHVSSLTADVFALSGLPEEVIAVLFAYYSRSRDDLRTNLAKLLADQELDVAEPARRAFGLASEKARSFHEKWVVGYGHASVAEHAVVHLAVENVSIIASKAIEDLRLGSYTEKSTRYVVFDQSSFVDLPELPEPLRARYQASCARLFATYVDLMPKVMDALRARVPRAEGTSEPAHAAAIRAQACDLLRGLLPAGAQTNLGLTANARALEILLSKMLSSPLAEVRRVGAEMRDASLTVAPTLVKYAAPSEHRRTLSDSVASAVRRVYTPPEEGVSATMVVSQPVRLVRHDKDAMERVALALAYESSQPGLHAFGVMEALRYASPAELGAIITASCAQRGPHDPPPRGFEASTMTFELMLDFGAWRDLQRHRMLTPAVQRLSCRLGFETPFELLDLGFAEAYQTALIEARDAWEELEQSHPLEAQYAVPLGYRVRALWTLNLRELFHVIELRSARQGHTSYRRLAQGLYRTTVAAHPWLKDLIRVDLN